MKSFKSIAHQILSEEGKPLYYREITNIAIKKGILITTGKRPWATMNSQLSMDIVNKGKRSEFIRTKTGCYSLKSLKKKL